MKFFRKIYYCYDLEYYFYPGLWMDQKQLTELTGDLETVKALSERNLNYGVFDKTLSVDEKKKFFDTANFCVIKEKGVPVGFFYNLVLAEEPQPVVHAGLVVLAKNKGYDLIGYPYSIMTCLQFSKFGAHFYTNISSTPSIVGVFSDSFSGVWPSYKANQIKPPSKEYYRVLDLLKSRYIEKFFKSAFCELDRKRFVLRSSSKEMGFEIDLKKLSRYHKPEVNYFCMFWLDYSKGEDLVQVGRVDWIAVIKIKLFYTFQKLKSLYKTNHALPHLGLGLKRNNRV